MIRPGKFSIENSPTFPGYTGGGDWNGFAMPVFSMEQAGAVLKEFHGEKMTPEDFADPEARHEQIRKNKEKTCCCWTYDPAKDAFFIFDENLEEPEETGIYEARGEDCEISTGGKIRVYCVTDGYCWDEDTTDLKKMLVMVTLTPGADPAYVDPFPTHPALPITKTSREIMIYTLNAYENAQQHLPEYAGRRKARFELTVLADNLTDEEIEKIRKNLQEG
jgi:hypothetical protein